jgi:thiamine-phosphate pyrophosphorylase
MSILPMERNAEFGVFRGAHMRFELPRIYPITDKHLARKNSHLAILKELRRGGARFVQIRDKDTPVRELLRDLEKCRQYAEAHNMTLILNDRSDLVLTANLNGVHLGQEDIPPEAARALLGKKRIIGYSTHTIAQVRQSLNLPLNYIGFGPVYETATKTNVCRAAGLKKLASTCRASATPVVAIGGIGLEEIRPVLDAGAACAAVISAIMTAESIARQTELFLETACRA